MATPLTTLNKYTGIAMIFLCGMLMVVFGLGDALTSGGNSQNGRIDAKETVAAWNDGSINEEQLGKAVTHRNVLASFQQAVYQLGTQSAQEAGVADVGLRVQPLQLPISLQQGVERDVVQTKIIAAQANKSGMVVSDEMIVDYLQAIGRDRVSSEQMRNILTSMSAGNGRGATIEFVFDLLREALLARNYTSSHNYAFTTVLPAERWEDWLLVNDRIILEAAPVNTADFLDKVGEPTEAEIAELFEKHGKREASPDRLREYGDIELPSPLPGFATPEQVGIQFVKADFSAYAKRLESEVTEEEIAKFYEENKESFIKADEALFGDSSLFEEDDATEEATEATAEETEEEATEETAEEPISEEVEGEAAEDEAVEEEEEEEEEADTSETDAEETASSEEATNEEAAETEPTNTASYQTLDEVRDQIRRRLGEIKATEAMREMMNEIKLELDDEFDEHLDAVLDAEEVKQPKPTAPAALSDLRPLAEKHDFAFEEISAISLLNLREAAIGQTQNADESASQSYPLWVLCFREGDLDLNEPAVSIDREGNLYLSVITSRTERGVPELEEVKDQVIAAWKQQKAAELALEEAKKLAAEAQEKGMPLSALFNDEDDHSSFETNPFGFLTIGNVSPTGQFDFRLSQPDPLVAPGPSLLETAVNLGTDEVAAELNHDHSIAYVIRVASHMNSAKELQTQFVQEGENWFGYRQMVSRRYRRATRKLYETLVGNSGLSWARTPDQTN